jgi:hypothetical protein
MPSISEIMAALYWSVVQLEKRTASIFFPEDFRISAHGPHAKSRIGILESFTNCEVAHEEIATLRILKG